MQAGPGRHGTGPARTRPCGRRMALMTGATALSISVSVVAFDAVAQDGRGIRLSFGIDQQFSHDSNLDLDLPRVGSTTASTTRLTFGLSSETRTERLFFSAGTTAILERGPSGDTTTTFDLPRYNLSYSRESARSLVSISGSYTTDLISFLRPLDDFLTELLDPDGNPVLGPDDEPILIIDIPEDLDELQGEGRREVTRLNGRLVLGRDGPLVTTLTAGLQDFRYVDASPNLTDTQRYNVAAAFTARLSPVTSASLSLGLEQFRDDNLAQTRRETGRIRVGISHAVSEALSFNVLIGPTRVETREFGVTTREEGIDGNIGLSYDLPNGSIGANLTAVTDQDGTRTSFSVNRSMELPRGSLSGSLGITRDADGDTLPIGTLSYRHPLPSGNFSISLTQGFFRDASDDSVARTALAMGYSHDINSLSSLNLRAAISVRDDGTDDRASLGATYRHEFTQDWGVNLGYRYDTRDQGSGRAENHGVFLSLSRSFETGL